jgi:hypothetical protein
MKVMFARDGLRRVRGTSYNIAWPFVLERVKRWGKPAHTSITKPSLAK